MNIINEYLDEIKKILSEIDIEKIQKLAEKISETKEADNTIFIIGNGGSATTASHWVCDLMKGTVKDYDSQKERLKVVCLADNFATISAYANDISYDVIFSQQLKNLARKNDLLIVLTGSGKSKNIINAVEVAKKSGVYTFGLLGADGGDIISKCDDSLLIPSRNYGIIEDIHLMVGHLITASIKNENNLTP